jgi:hypothetical protein
MNNIQGNRRRGNTSFAALDLRLEEIAPTVGPRLGAGPETVAAKHGGDRGTSDLVAELEEPSPIRT